MFDMETALAAWRREMNASIKVPQRREELESHLREEIERQLRSGANAADAFAAAVAQIGPAQPIKAEFAKVDVGSCNHPLAWTAWILFAASFFLPAFGETAFSSDCLQGWEIAKREWGAAIYIMSLHWLEGGIWQTLFVLLLTLANLLMVASPFLLIKFSHRSYAMNLFRRLSFVALLLVWTDLVLLLAIGLGSYVKIGLYLRAVSFLPLWLCTLPRWQTVKHEQLKPLA